MLFLFSLWCSLNLVSCYSETPLKKHHFFIPLNSFFYGCDNLPDWPHNQFVSSWPQNVAFSSLSTHIYLTEPCATTTDHNINCLTTGVNISAKLPREHKVFAVVTEGKIQGWWAAIYYLLPNTATFHTSLQWSRYKVVGHPHYEKACFLGSILILVWNCQKS